MFFFQQTPDSFHVQESLLYPLSGEGGQTFVQIEKRDIATNEVKKIISGNTGVPLKNIHHAGMKDRAATAIQWLSWPTHMLRTPLPEHNRFKVLQMLAHETPLRLGHVAFNHFRLLIRTDNPQLIEARLNTRFPNYYGPQRFGRADADPRAAVKRLESVGRQKDAVSVIQSALFNAWLKQRLEACGETPQEQDYWTGTNGKRCFQAEYDNDLAKRFGADEITPTGPMFGYKVRLTEKETNWLAAFELTPESFRKCGKSAKGARRPIFIRPKNPALEPMGEDRYAVSFDLPSGAYATVALTWLAHPDLLGQPMDQQPNYLNGFQLP